MNARIRAQSAPWHNGVELYIGTTDGSAVVKNFILEERDAHTAIDPSAAIRLEPENAQTLMDDLWQAGIRPTEGAGTAGSMKATQKHLEDMRAIAAFCLEIKLP